MIQISVIEEPSRLPDLKGDWDRLVANDAQSELFNTYEWIDCWILHYWDPAYKLHVVTLTLNDCLFCILPLYFNGLRNAYYFLGSGEQEVAEVSTEYLNYLLLPQYQTDPQVTSFIAGHLHFLGKKLVILNTVTRSHIYCILQQHKRVIAETTGIEYKIALSNFDNYTKTLSKKERKKAQQALNRFAKTKELSFQIAESDDWHRFWLKLQELHQSDWQARGKPGAFYEAKFIAFHEHLRRSASQSEQVLSVLMHGETVLAVNHYYLYKHTLYFYSTGSVKNAFNSLSPGIMLHILSISHFSKSGLEYNFLKGNLNESYKGRLCSPGDNFFSLTLYPDTFSGHAALTIQKTKKLLKRLING